MTEIVLFWVTAWLLVGAVLMLLANDYARPLSEQEFVVGMFVWPVACVAFLGLFARNVIRGARG